MSLLLALLGTGSAISAEASGDLSITGQASGNVLVKGGISGSLALSGTAVALAPINASAAGDFIVTGSAQASLLVQSSIIGSLDLAGSAETISFTSMPTPVQRLILTTRSPVLPDAKRDRSVRIAPFDRSVVSQPRKRAA